jgi:hypothetical protein
MVINDDLSFFRLPRYTNRLGVSIVLEEAIVQKLLKVWNPQLEEDSEVFPNIFRNRNIGAEHQHLQHDLNALGALTLHG